MTAFAHDTWVLTLRALGRWRRQPGTTAVGLLFPVLMIVMFGYLLGGQMRVEGGSDYFDYLVPAVFGLAMVFGIEGTMIAVTTDASRGITDRFRTLPMAAAAVLGGRAMADMLHAVVGLAALVVAGLLVGWRWENGVDGLLAALGLALLLRFALVWVGIWLGLRARGPEDVVAVQILVWPFAFLSGAFVAPSSMPDWLGTIAELNPLSSTVIAIRELLGNPGWGGDSWMATHAVELAIAWPLVLTAVVAPLAVRRFRRLSR
jgi:ABC-2 type transport system permease protein